MKIVMDF